MEAQVVETQAMAARRATIPAIRWGAVIGGAVAGIASYMLLTLLGIAVGLTALEPAAGQPSAAVPIASGIWSIVSMLVSAFIGGYVAARMSGLSRRMDGILHGFVAWATVMVIFVWLTTTAVGALLGGAFSLVSQGTQAAAAGGQQQGQGIASQIQSIITGTEGGEISGDDMRAVTDRLRAGDRQGAIDYMTRQMGFTQERATTVVDNLAPVVGPGGEQRAAQAADTAVDTLAAASWWLFIGILISLGASVWGGLVAARAVSQRTLGDHSDERHFRTF